MVSPTPATAKAMFAAVWDMATNDEVALTPNEADLSQSSTPPWLTEDATRARSNRLLGITETGNYIFAGCNYIFSRLSLVLGDTFVFACQGNRIPILPGAPGWEVVRIRSYYPKDQEIGIIVPLKHKTGRKTGKPNAPLD